MKLYVESLGRPPVGNYQCHNLRLIIGLPVIAIVTTYDDGQTTIEFDNEMAYPADIVEDILNVAKSLKSK